MGGAAKRCKRYTFQQQLLLLAGLCGASYPDCETFDRCLSMAMFDHFTSAVDADRLLARATEMRPDSKEAWLRRGALAQDAGQLEFAEDHLSRALALDPMCLCWRLGINLGNLAARLGDMTKAERVFTHVIRTNPLVAQTFFSRGFLHFLQGQLSHSCSSFQRAWALNPDFHNLPEFSFALDSLKSLRSAMVQTAQIGPPHITCPIQHLDTKNHQHSDFVTYHSSDWEQLWLDNIHLWQNVGICEALAGQQEQVHSFMNDTCSARTDTPWCMLADSVQILWYHTLDGRVQRAQPDDIRQVFPITPLSVGDKNHHTGIWSWFERKNIETGEVTNEYIEPLVSHLRHPLALCAPFAGSELHLIDRTYILPGTVSGTKRTLLFDAGASSWDTG